jgi:iron complex outermembrane receptor protein/vitamin B12 transporter
MVVRRLVLKALMLGCILSILSGMAVAQGTASLKVTVLDPVGARIPNATVTLHREDGPVKDTKSDSQGEAVFEGLVSGRYWLDATADRFQPRTTAPLFVSSTARIALDVALPLGPLETGVTVTAAANELLPSQTGAPVTVIDDATITALGKLDLLEALRLVPGASITQTGGRGGTTSIFIRGGNPSFNKMLVDGVPANDIGGAIDLERFTLAGVSQIEVLREANSVAYGSDALAGVISLTSPRGQTGIPQVTLSADEGSLGTLHGAAAIAGAFRRFDYFSEFAGLATRNDLPNNKYDINTYAGRFGFAAGHNTDITATVRWIDSRMESPNAMSLYAIPDDFFGNDKMKLFGVSVTSQLTERWSGALRFAASDQRSRLENPTLSGEDIFGVGFGDTVTITGANGYSATGRGAVDFGTFLSESRSTRQGIYAQSTFQAARMLSLSGGGNYEREQAFSDPDGAATTNRNNKAAWVEGRGNFFRRINATAGLSYAHNEAFKSAYSPRLSVTAFLRSPATRSFWGDTRVTLNVGRGFKAASVLQADSSLYQLLVSTPAGAAQAESAGIGPMLPERSRNFDVGVEQGLWGRRARVRVVYFDNRFFDLVEFVSKGTLPQFGVPADVANATPFGAYVNSQSFNARGVETSADALIGRFRLAASYTYLDAEVTKSLTGSAIAPQFNPSFPGIPIGGFGPLVGERPFRRPANTGNLMVSYTQGAATIALSGYFAGKSDDSTFIQGADINFENSLLLPNQNLNFGYAKMDLSVSYKVHPGFKWYGTIENLLNQSYEPAFGFPALPINFRIGLVATIGGGL